MFVSSFICVWNSSSITVKNGCKPLIFAEACPDPNGGIHQGKEGERKQSRIPRMKGLDLNQKVLLKITGN